MTLTREKAVKNNGVAVHTLFQIKGVLVNGFPILWNDWQWFLHFEWSRQTQLMLDYIETSETLFDKEIETFGDWIEKQQGEISDDNAEHFHDNCAARMRLLADDFPVLARHMAFCAMFGFFEHQLIHVCDAIQVFRKLPTNVRDEDDSGMQGAKTYLKNVAQLDFPDNTRQWPQLVAFGRIRNLILHNEAQVPSHRLEAFNKDAKLVGGIQLDSFRRFVLTKDFCLMAVNTVQGFFDALVKVLPRETAQDREESLEKLAELMRAGEMQAKHRKNDTVAD